MIRRASLLALTVSLACDGGSTAPADASPPATAVPDTAAPAEDSNEAPTLEVLLTELDAAAPGALARAVEAFATSHPPETVDEELAVSIERLVAFVHAGADALDVTVQKDPALLSAACAAVDVECGGPPTEQAKTDLAALGDRGVHVLYTGEGTVKVSVDRIAIAVALGDAVPEGARAWLTAQGTTEIAESRYDEGGFGGDPNLMAEALLRWEALEAMGDPVWGKDAASEALRLRTAYLRLCDHGEWETPPCNARKPLRESYASFAKDHAGSPSAPAVASVRAALKKKRWKATAEQLDAIVAKALDAAPAAP